MHANALTHFPAQEPKLAELVARIERLRGQARLRLAEVAELGLSEKLGGDIPAPGLIRIERNYPLWHRVGRLPLAGLLEARGEGLPEDPQRCLFLDTETSGFSGGSGSLAFMVGIGRLTPAGFLIRQYLMTGFAAEPALLDALRREISGQDTLVSFNGKSHDLPLLAARFRRQGRANPLSGPPHLDLRHPLRRLHGKGLPDCRLRTLEARVLGHRRDMDLPGSTAPQAWLKWLKQGETGLLPALVQHNRGDILAMAGLCQCLGATGPA